MPDQNPRPVSDAETFYNEVFRAELQEIAARREARGLGTTMRDWTQDMTERPRCELGLVGLALSGGGVRSATFNLGVLQGIAKIRHNDPRTNPGGPRALFPLFDYLSTVSGGGYIGSWLAGWMKNAGPYVVEEELEGKALTWIREDRETPEPRPIQHLRDYSNYLTPTLGLFSADTWSAIATYLRNILVNQLVIAPLAAALLLVPRLLAMITPRGTPPDESIALPASIAVAVPAGLLTALAVWVASYGAGSQALWFTQRWLQVVVCIPLLLAGILVLWIPIDTTTKYLVLFVLLNIVAVVIGWPLERSTGAEQHRVLAIVFWFASAVAGGLAAGLSIAAAFGAFGQTQIWKIDPGGPWHLVVWGPPLALVLIVTALHFQLGLRGKYESDMSREWWASMAGWLLTFAFLWALIAAVSIYGPLVFELLQNWTATRYTLLASWLATTVGAVLAGRSPKTGALQITTRLDYVARTLAPLAILGFLIAVSIGVHSILVAWTGDDPPSVACGGAPPTLATGTLEFGPYHTANVEIREGRGTPAACEIIGQYFGRLDTQKWENNLKLFALFVFLGVIMGIAIDVNQFSLQAFYRNRLVRCYLRAIRPPGDPRPHPIHGFDPLDDFPLAKLTTNRNVYLGPYLLINTALNITDATRLGWQERKAMPFLFASRYSGSNLTGYRPTENYADKVKLGTALAISGAAFSTNMGYQSSRALAFFLSLFNVRLGWWIGNPAGRKYYRQGPWCGLFYLFAELFGRTNEKSEYIYLSDGGHFDNLGLYELVRRRCRYIVCCDAGEDSCYSFEDLGMAIRKIRADFGIDIEIDLEMVKPQTPGGYSRWRHAIGTIRYDVVDENSPVGMLVYIKAALVGDEPADVLEYRSRHADFPHEPTLDQFFSESQFEAYRALGRHAAREVLRYAQGAL